MLVLCERYGGMAAKSQVATSAIYDYQKNSHGPRRHVPVRRRRRYPFDRAIRIAIEESERALIIAIFIACRASRREMNCDETSL